LHQKAPERFWHASVEVGHLHMSKFFYSKPRTEDASSSSGI